MMIQGGLNLAQYWQQRLSTECPEESQDTRQSIFNWLLGGDLERFNLLNPKEIEIAKQAMEYRCSSLNLRNCSL